MYQQSPPSITCSLAHPKWVCALSALVLAACLNGAPAAASDDWPGFRGPNGNGQLVEGLPQGSGELQLRVRWQRPLGSGYSGIALVSGVAVTATSDAERDLVMSFDPETGVERWRADLGPLTVGIGGSKDGPISTPTIADSRVFMVSTLGKVVALDLHSGEQLWSVELIGDLGSARPAYGFSTSPIAVGDLVVVQSGGSAGALVGLEASTGALRWRTFDDRHYAQSPIVTELGGRTQLVAMGSAKVAGIDPADGQTLWSYAHGGAGEFGAESASPMPIGGGRLFIKHDNERSKVIQVEIQEDESFGVEVLNESRTMTRSYGPPTVWGNTAYGYTSRFLSALDLSTGEELWRSRAPGDGFLLAIEGHLLVATKNKGTVHLGKASPDSWQELDQVELFEDLVWTSPSSAAGAFFVRSLTEMARVDLVRSQITSSESQTLALPAELEAVRRKIGEGLDASAAVDELLEGLNGPLINGDRALFLWQGDAAEVGVAGDMFGFRYDEPMRRLEGTDLWWLELDLDRRGRFNYAYFPDYIPTLDPLNERTAESTAMGPDLNHRGDEVLQMSWFAMPDWPGHELSPPPPNSQTKKGRLETFDVEVDLPSPSRRSRAGTAGADSTQSVVVPVTVWLPPGYDDESGDIEVRYPTVFALERYAIRLGNWPDVLDAVVGASDGRVRPLIAIMIDAPDGFYGRRGGGRVGLLVPEVQAEVDKRYRTIAEPNARAVSGALYTGPPALALALAENGLFGRVAVQSPFAIDATLPMHRHQIARAESAPRLLAFYFEWAHWDMRSRLEGLVLGDYMQDVFELFKGAGYPLVGGEVWDSTDWNGWRNRTHLILEVLFPGANSGEQAANELDRWLVDPKR